MTTEPKAQARERSHAPGALLAVPGRRRQYRNTDPEARCREAASARRGARLCRRERRAARGVRVLMVDNYDSFTYNLVHLFEELARKW